MDIKVLEQLISKQITKFDNYLEQCITAYRKSHSCETTLIPLVEHWKLGRDKRQSIAVLSKAVLLGKFQGALRAPKHFS